MRLCGTIISTLSIGSSSCRSEVPGCASSDEVALGTEGGLLDGLLEISGVFVSSTSFSVLCWTRGSCLNLVSAAVAALAAAR